jgi:O-antigen/teichoic acid export membrane protein
LRRVFVTTTRWILVVTLPLFLLFAVLPGSSIKAVFGSNYTPAALALSIITVGSFISVVVGPVNSCLAGLGMTRTLLMTTLVSAVSNVLLSFTLIPVYGLVGAAIAWTVARALYPTSGLLNLYRSHGISPVGRTLVVPLAVSLGVGVPFFVAIRYIHFPFWGVFPLYFVGAGIFLAALLLTRSVEEGDLIAFRHLEKVIGRPLPFFERLLKRGIPHDGARGPMPRP